MRAERAPQCGEPVMSYKCFARYERRRRVINACPARSGERNHIQKTPKKFSEFFERDERDRRQRREKGARGVAAVEKRKDQRGCARRDFREPQQ